MTRVASQLQRYSAIAAFAMLLAVQWVHSPFHHLAEISGEAASSELASCHFHSSTHVHVGQTHSHSHRESSRHDEAENTGATSPDECLGHLPEVADDTQDRSSQGTSSQGEQDHSEECELCDDLSKSLVNVALVGEPASSSVVVVDVLPSEMDYDSPIRFSWSARGPPSLV
ncbi:hypothetical protein KOR42_22030 [Thalassoglobus neptunius]|uniref:Uncharacterized protein n=1 Tax=Thalassoglobus neptunius TaxID=1938619 RepID=A0A5C5X6S6_9PLAN|nr:hypothetical protein [Thalassoglobus neptunius]TWT58817.1 hypothetical protein KOR42_22030 [Thalassoglobus neptunius]